ncbi:ADP-ribose pyrophosphatase YjhB, NUDIX family [Psychrobacillus psychrotolerans]|uniref:ADP-ribose pyrophosphatase YjhB, NUDIX family n=1 Tax=Psychrobacillus psychrotolerans TaxID=126156 RepID=A0A1I5ZJU0_9BACI|nr:NUDIX hydrolase [Psychrobacillus psychrotolerans]SFQ56718.1 ADP-ribose pyrophosphatase YjhB, NUDIX family [Psychrobacillus psychrotolerans]
MFSWKGAAGICVNEQNEVLMVLQAAPGEEKKWTVPSGTLEEDETIEECCIREFVEETGFVVKTLDKIHNKNGVISEHGISYSVEYFLVEIISGEITIQDPDEFIHDIAWKSLEEIQTLDLAYPEDIHIIEKVIKNAMDELPN